MCQGVKDGEKPGTSKADRKQPGKQKGNRKEVSFWRAGENVLETSEINSSVPLRTRQMRAEKGTAPLACDGGGFSRFDGDLDVKGLHLEVGH